MRATTMICRIFGEPLDLNPSILPTKEEVLRYYFHKFNIVREENGGKSGYHPDVSVISQLVAADLLNLWTRASIPAVSLDAVLKQIKTYYTKYRSLMKSWKSRQHTQNFKDQVQRFKVDASNLFDISACKCLDFARCKCSSKSKIPVVERSFIQDQRTDRKRYIGPVDVPYTAKVQKRIHRVSLLEERALQVQKKEVKDFREAEAKLNLYRESESLHMEYDGNDIGNKIQSTNALPEPERPTCSQQRISLKRTATVAARYELGHRATAAIISAVLEDHGIVTPQDTSKVVDKNKVRREMKKVMVSLQKEGQASTLRGLYFDGRKDLTLVQKEINDKRYQSSIREEHISMVKQPENTYLGHTTPVSGCAKDICESMLNTLKEMGVGTENLRVLGSDGTVVNTGHLSGVIRVMEVYLKRPVQWCICLLHANELPLRHLLQDLDGHTTGPYSYSGPIGLAIQNCELRPTVRYAAIDAPIPQVDMKVLSTEQKYMFEMHSAIVSGYCSDDLAARNPGKLNLARWTTTANRVMREYVSNCNPSEHLVIIVTFIIKVYVQVWFQIKVHHSIADAAKHVWKMISLSRYLREDARLIVDRVIQTNAFYAHPESILLSMITDEDADIKYLGYRRIVEAREREKGRELEIQAEKLKTKTQNAMKKKGRPRKKSELEVLGIRNYKVPILNFNSKAYYEMINWETESITSPPILSHISNDNLQRYINGHSITEIDFKEFPCHTQSVERCVKLVTEASAKCYGQKTRDGIIRARIYSREHMPHYECKGQYKPT